LRGASEWLFERHGTAKRRPRRKFYIGSDANSGEIVAFDLTGKAVDDASHVEPLLDQLNDAPDSFIADGADDRSAVFDAVLASNPDDIHRFTMQRSCAWTNVATSLTQSDRHVPWVEERGRMNWRNSSGYNKRSKVEAAINRYKRVVGDTLKSRDVSHRETEVAIAVKSLNRMRDLGRAICARVA
jgi:Transposase DDE domain